ncbi:MAG: HupE/UreJ family protein [Sandaracinaceae bacterium]
MSAAPWRPSPPLGAAAAAVVAIVALLPSPARAHPLRFGALRVVEGASGDVVVTLRYSGTERAPFGSARPRLPERCEPAGPAAQHRLGDRRQERRRYACGPAGLTGGWVGLSAGGPETADVLVEVRRADGREVRGVLSGPDDVVMIPEGPGERGAWAFGLLGVEHILLGPDHLLFVAALVLLVAGRRTLLLTVTAFTVGHSVTLVLAALGAVRVPAPPVEAAIALSLLLLAVELTHREPTWTRRAPYLVAGVFGLVHGLGFASALLEGGLPEDRVVLRLLAFNLGVEAGQVLFVAVLLALLALGRQAGWDLRTRPLPAAYALGVLSGYWTIERLAAFV